MKAFVRISARMILMILALVQIVACGGDLSESDNDTNNINDSGYTVVDTGQTACYDDDGNEITCPESGEAFAGQDAQYEGNQFNYTDNRDGTVTDNVTGLMWQQTPGNTGLSWQEAVDNCESLELAGYDDWRLPNVKELQSIVDYTRSPSASNAADLGPAIDTDFFDITELASGTTNYSTDYGYFWSSTSAYHSPASPEYYYAWYVAFGTAVDAAGEDFHGAGAVRFDTKVEGGPLGEGGERYYNYVRLVRTADL